MQLKCIIIISNNVNLSHKFLCDFIHKKTASAFSKKSGKNVIKQDMLAKIISISSCKINISHAKFCMIPCNVIRDRTMTSILEQTE